MARFYSNENLPLRAVQSLRALGHDVLTSLEADRAPTRESPMPKCSVSRRNKVGQSSR